MTVAGDTPPRYDFERLRATQLYGPSRRVDAGYRSGHWAEPIDRLLGAGYSFTGWHFGDGGHLFRGVQSGLRAGLAAGVFSHFDGDDELCGVERVMNVTFLSHEPGDAITVARMHESPEDAAILVIPASVFEQALAVGEAAVLAVGDAGIVFRYPLLARPLRLAEVSRLFVHESAIDAPGAPGDAQPARSALAGCKRSLLERHLLAQCARHSLDAAQPVPTGRFPRR